jgi:N-acetylneuraminic acid mutarotase
MTKALRLAVATVGLLLVFLLLTGAVSLANAHAILAKGKWSFTGSLHMPRAGHRGTRLTSMVLVAGGGLVSSEIYNATTGTWSPTGSMNIARSDNTQTRLTNGQVLVTGGRGSSGVLASAEVYIP